MNQPLLERRSPTGLTYALLILMVFFFLIPSAFRAARLSLGQKENDVKDWLPSDFPETSELDWFADHFTGEAFVLATWPGCTGSDKRLRLFEHKLRHESAQYDPTVGLKPSVAKQYKVAKETGTRLQLLPVTREFDNWGGKNEKWLGTPRGQWYYITPDGRLYRWDAATNGPAKIARAISRALFGKSIDGKLITAFGDQKKDGKNVFYNDLSLICAPLFETVETGDSIAQDLSKEDGALWPIDLTEEARRPIVAKRKAMERMTGTLFGPAVPADFAWTPEAFRNVVPDKQREQLPESFDALIARSLRANADYYFDGDMSKFSSASTELQAKIWYEAFDDANVSAPERQTCVLVTLTELAKNNLSYAVGRGVMGGPRGRLLQLAKESGVMPAPPPSMAPPPFDAPEPISAAGVPPLRIGGPPVDNVAIDEEGTITLVRLVGYSILVGFVLSYLCFASFKITMMVFIVGGSAAMLSLSCVWWTGGKVDAILMSMPSLVYVLGLSGAIHVINYYRDEVRAGGKSGAAGRALRHALLPCTLASVTTAIGLVSLHTSNLAPISNFGLYSAIGVIATLTILFTYLPASLQIFAPSCFAQNKSEADSDNSGTKQPEHATITAEKESFLSDAWASVGRWITAHHGLVATACIAFLIIATLGLSKIKTSVQLLKLFDPQSRIIADYGWMESNFGKLVPMELILRVPPHMQAELLEEKRFAQFADSRPSSPNPVDQPDRIDSVDPVDPIDTVKTMSMLRRVEVVSRISTVVRRTLGEPGLNEVGNAMSADTFLPPLPTPGNGYSPVRTKFNRELLAARNDLLTSDYLRIEESGEFEGSELWRISLRVAALSDTDYGYFISTLRTAVEPVLRAYDTREELLSKLAHKDGKVRSKLSGKDRVLVVGSERPASLDVARLIKIQDKTPSTVEEPGQQPDNETIDTQAIFLSTLGEILSGEPMRRPVWIDPQKMDKPIKVGSDRWKKLINAFDAVVWVGGGGTSETDFAGAKRFINAKAISDKDAHPELIAGSIPSVANSGDLQVVYTGVIPVVYKAQRTLLSSLVQSIGTAFVLIALVMVVLLNPGRFPLSWLMPSHLKNGILAGTVSMIPNVFPVLLVFGIMGHRGDLVDIGTMMTASVAMGVAVDDTIHFLSWFRAFLDKGMDRVEAVIQTYRRVGPAMTQTTIVGGLGLFVFALSTFTPTQRFGTLMLVLLGAALVGDLILLPALLAGPLGRCFKRREASQLTNEQAPSHRPSTTSGNESQPAASTVEPSNSPEVTKKVMNAPPPLRLKLHLPDDDKGASDEQPRRVKG